MLFLGSIFLLSALCALSVSLGLVALPDRAVRSRLLDEDRVTAAEKPSGKRIRQVDAPEDAARLVVSGGMLRRIERNLLLAGHPAGWSMRNIIMAKILIPIPVLLLMTKV
ncbi:MAG: tight adherence protein, partial [Nocardioidaceae bacterium]|nr:tight adherence protein [Nocardioidaceae bacterium]